MAIEFKFVSSVTPVEYRKLNIASQAYAIGDAAMWNHTGSATVDVVPATSSTVTSSIAAVSMEVHASTDTVGLFAIVTPWQYWAADTANTANAAHNNQRMVLTNASVVNNTGTDSAAGIFQQTGLLGNISTTRIVGRFLAGFSAA